MKILIADDERLIRMNLIAMIEELYSDIHIIDEARDGEELLQKLQEAKYDLVFVDINMPKKTGLQAMEEYKKDTDNINWCVLSGYTDFEYAKKAISLGVKEYLLKPVDMDALRQFMESVISEIQDKKWREHLLYEKKVDQIFSLADSSDIIQPLELEDNENEFSLFVFFINAANNKRKKFYRNLYKRLSEYIFKNVSISDRFAMFTLQTGEMCLLIEGSNLVEIESYVKNNGNEMDMQKMVTVYAQDEDFHVLYERGQEILKLSPMHIVRKNLEVVSIEEIIKSSEQEFILDFCEKMELITSCYVTGNYAEALEIYYEIEADERYGICYDVLDEEALVSYLSITWDVTFENCGYAGLLKVLKRNIQEQIMLKGGQNNQLIDKIKKYVKENFANNMSISEIGDYFDITPSYISRVFKEKTGEKLIDYITGVRMKKAKELLLTNPNISIKEVAERVGYSSEKHFSKIFRKRFNCLPSKYVSRSIDENRK